MLDGGMSGRGWRGGGGSGKRVRGEFEGGEGNGRVIRTDVRRRSNGTRDASCC